MPTFAEAGLGAFALDAWFVVVAPARRRPMWWSKIGRRCQEIVADPRDCGAAAGDFDRARADGAEDPTPFIQAEIEKWAMLVKAAGIDPE